MTEHGSPLVRDTRRLAAVAATGLIDTDPEPAFDELASLAARLLQAPFAFVTLVDETRSFWKARIGIPPDGPSGNQVEESFCQYVIASGEPLIAGDVTENPLTADNPSITSMGVRAWAGFPLLSPEGQALGSFCVVDTVVRDWSADDVETLRLLSAAAGREVALRGSIRQASQANDQLHLLATVAAQLGATLDADEAVARLARLVVPTLGDWSIVALADRHGLLTDVGWWHAREQSRPLLDKFASQRLTGLGDTGATHNAQSIRKPVILDSGALPAGLAVLMSEQARDAYRELNPAAYGVWPLAIGDAVHGVIVIARDSGRPSFTRAETQLAEDIADRAAVVLDNARLYARERDVTAALGQANERLRQAGRHDRIVARALQKAMLTTLPEPDHLYLAGRYLTADSADQVGGDWYDALLPPGGATTLVIGDVAGHDIAAATVMGQLRNMLRTLAWVHRDESPAAILTHLDRAMVDFSIPTLTTAVLARIEQSSADAVDGRRTLRWSTAGHPAPVLIDADGSARLLDARPDPPLASVRNATRRDHTVSIGPQQTLLLYTDGLVETRTEDLGTRQAQLLDVIYRHRGLGLDELLTVVLSEMIDDEPDDDVALIAVRCRP